MDVLKIFGKRYISEDKLKEILKTEYDFYQMNRDSCAASARFSFDPEDRRCYSSKMDMHSKLMYCVAELGSKIEKTLSAKRI